MIRSTYGHMLRRFLFFVSIFLGFFAFNDPRLASGRTPSPQPTTSANNPSLSDPDTIIRLKIFLDQHSFGTGEIDNHWSDLCANALRLYQTANVHFLMSLNHRKNLNNLHPGDVVQVPNVPPLEVEGLKAADDIPPRPELKTHSIEVDTKNKVLTVTDGKSVLAAFPITPGSKQLPAPIGTWQVVKIATLPWFRWDKSMLLHGRRSSDFHSIPPGPRNEVGVVWIGLNKKGIGIHGTNSPGSIGRSASHGCIRLANWDAVRVMNLVTQGITVQIN
jgi:hypothetical protein